MLHEFFSVKRPFWNFVFRRCSKYRHWNEQGNFHWFLAGFFRKMGTYRATFFNLSFRNLIFTWNSNRLLFWAIYSGSVVFFFFYRKNWLEIESRRWVQFNIQFSNDFFHFTIFRLLLMDWLSANEKNEKIDSYCVIVLKLYPIKIENVRWIWILRYWWRQSAKWHFSIRHFASLFS